MQRETRMSKYHSSNKRPQRPNFHFDKQKGVIWLIVIVGCAVTIFLALDSNGKGGFKNSDSDTTTVVSKNSKSDKVTKSDKIDSTVSDSSVSDSNADTDDADTTAVTNNQDNNDNQTNGNQGNNQEQANDNQGNTQTNNHQPMPTNNGTVFNGTLQQAIEYAKAHAKNSYRIVNNGNNSYRIYFE